MKPHVSTLKTLVLLIALALLPLSGRAMAQQPAIDTLAEEAIIVDMTTGTVLLEKNADQRMPTSSMSKIMTIYMLFEALDDGRISLDDTLPVSEKAWRMGGSKMFVEVGTQVRVEDLIRGIVVQSGNDASVVVAEGLAGSEEEFARRMTEKAHELGLLNSNFVNATGWPHPDHYSTARDLALLAQHLITDFPDYYHYFAELEFTYHEIRQGNRNPLLYRNLGADGLKTGHTEAAGYGLTASAVRDGRRLILVVNGLPTMSDRVEESARLMDWAFREFDTFELFAADETIETAQTWMGTPATVPMVSAHDVAVTLRHASREELRVTARVEEPIATPIQEGQPIGTLEIAVGEETVREIPLLAGEPVERQGFFGRVWTGAKSIVLGQFDGEEAADAEADPDAAAAQ